MKILMLERKPEQQFVSSEALKPGKQTLGKEFTRESAGPHGENLGKMKLYINDKVVAQGPMKTQLGKFTLSGDGLWIGNDSGDAVSQEYKTPGTFTGGKIFGVGRDRREGSVHRSRKGGGASVNQGLVRAFDERTAS